MLKRTTIFLDEKLLRRLKALANARGTTLTAVVREAMATYLAEPVLAGAIPSVAGRFASGHHDTSEHVDELLWKDPHG